ncbi:MAG: hypothetical protein KAI18_00260 [Candidatus Aenigmarchaeota archaeon]|nr:hypothetical protein [Candidatus Aenigmarchaeota archaeon]
MGPNKTIRSREIKYLSFAITILGLIILIQATNTFTPDTILIKNIDETFQGDYISTCGTVIDIRTSTKNTFITLESEKASIDSIFFDTLRHITINSHVCITGKIEIYKGTVEIIGDRIIEQ